MFSESRWNFAVQAFKMRVKSLHCGEHLRWNWLAPIHHLWADEYVNEKEEKGLGELRLKKLATEIHYIRRLFEQFNHCVCYSVNIEDVDASKGLTELYESQMINLRAKFQKNPKCREDLMLNFPFSFYSLCTNHVQFLTLNFSLHILW